VLGFEPERQFAHNQEMDIRCGCPALMACAHASIQGLRRAIELVVAISSVCLAAAVLLMRPPMMSRPPMIPRNVLNNSRGSRPIYVIVADDFGVQGRLECQLELLDAESVAGHLLMAGSFFPFLAAHRGELFANEMFADLFPSGRGRPSVPTDVMASVITLQALHGLSDSETGPTKWLSQSPPEAKPVIGSYWSNQPGSSQYRIGIKQEPHSAASSYLHICTNIGAGDRESPVEPTSSRR
jgi:hypothetical protein